MNKNAGFRVQSYLANLHLLLFCRSPRLYHPLEPDRRKSDIEGMLVLFLGNFYRLW